MDLDMMDNGGDNEYAVKNVIRNEHGCLLTAVEGNSIWT